MTRATMSLAVHSRSRRWILAMAWMVLCATASAQTLRDPTMPPSQAGLASAASGADASQTEPVPLDLMVRNGKPFVVAGTRLVAQGQMLGNARIERIGETEIWLRENGSLRKLPRFAGIERRSVAPLRVGPGCQAKGLAAQPGAGSKSTRKLRRSVQNTPQAAPCVASN